VEFKQDWTEPINDGFQDYGAGTDVTNITAPIVTLMCDATR
jgi:hypothetical protein